MLEVCVHGTGYNAVIRHPLTVKTARAWRLRLSTQEEEGASWLAALQFLPSLPQEGMAGLLSKETGKG